VIDDFGVVPVADAVLSQLNEWICALEHH
jgi:hypothetical protein